MSSCPSGTEIKSYIEFLRTYSEDHKNLNAVDSLRKGIKEWQSIQTKIQKKKQKEGTEANSNDTSPRRSKRWCWIFGKRNKK